MNSNIGKNIMKLAKVLGIIYIIAGILVGFFIWIDTEDFLLALISFAGGFVLNLSCWLLYGFGHLIETVNGIKANQENN